MNAFIFWATLLPFSVPTAMANQALENSLRKIEPKYHLVSTFSEPSDQGCSILEYHLPYELRLQPNEVAYFEIPDALHEKDVIYANLSHRQDPRTQRGSTNKEQLDRWPGLTSIQLWSESDQHWHYWAGNSSGKFGAKFAEVRSKPEREGLNDWGKIGHIAISNGRKFSKNPLHASVLRLMSVGLDPVLVSNIAIKFLPPTATQETTVIFTPNTTFGDPFTLEGTHLGGGQKYKGTFPNAFKLIPWSVQYRSPIGLPNGWTTQNGGVLVFNPTPGMLIQEAEIALGDTKPDGIRNDDGGWGSHGGSFLRVYLQHADGTFESWIRNENVPPEGILRAAPHECGYKTKLGDRLIFSVSEDISYLMGIRIRYSDRP